jgi:protein-S-isoprenylcysteine O-methyltransferase Ste14
VRVDPWNVVFLVGFVIYVWIRGAFEAKTRGQAKVVSHLDGRDRVLMALVFIGCLLLPLVYLFTPLLDFANYRSTHWARATGAVVMAAGLWLFYRSHADLGRNWSISLEVREGHELIQHGVYRRVRHPMYAAIWLIGIAQMLLLPNWIAGPSAVVAFAIMYFARIAREERMLCEHFGDAYRDYMRRSGRVVPRWRT